MKAASRMIKISALAIALTLSGAFSVSAASYKLDKSHTYVGFVVKHLVISKVKGNFKDFEGGFDFDEKTKKLSNVSAVIQTQSIDTDNEKRDGHLKSGDFFKADEHKTITFKSTNAKHLGGNSYEVVGDLTMRGVTKSITLKGQLLGVVEDSYFGNRAGLTASATINRKDWGVSWNKSLDAGGLAVADEVELLLEIEAVRN